MNVFAIWDPLAANPIVPELWAKIVPKTLESTTYWMGLRVRPFPELWSLVKVYMMSEKCYFNPKPL